ncbi:hypothetical protein M427DRAFT_56778 [Gonapodya prolifera JEL478]|uniref:Hemerythrin-like domain-containing protein n=1 Tax=Gonapodya prolifera (strain JEL478) TaxID=1344416 RepID=A0A139AF96_GONPJ|nr:hypothetical protein M427DRAFT_56778 [Gonapodya prolifera JEL478]|eukprot:KXS15430.1 hypothetical protein M427DRAFT_56778 [Gonapodya prolifera JEL478]
MQTATKPLPSALQTKGSISKRIISDHKVIFHLYDRYQDATDPNLREKIENTIIREIAVHSAVEEIVVYPVIEKNFENGKAQADKLRAEHLQVKKDLQNFDAKRETTLLSKIIGELRGHVDYEEQQEIPQLKAKLTTEEDQSLAAQWDKTRLTVPTRPHPLAPDQSGITEATAGMLAKPLDAIMNATREFVEVVREE